MRTEGQKTTDRSNSTTLSKLSMETSQNNQREYKKAWSSMHHRQAQKRMSFPNHTLQTKHLIPASWCQLARAKLIQSISKANRCQEKLRTWLLINSSNSYRAATLALPTITNHSKDTPAKSKKNKIDKEKIQWFRTGWPKNLPISRRSKADRSSISFKLKFN